jgi:succinyl-diaminopimelate desuccinylase
MFNGSLAQRTLALASIASVTGQEQSLCDELAVWLSAKFPESTLLRWRNGLVIRSSDQVPERAHIALVGHLDTVPPSAVQSLGIRDGRVWGCGTTDMKGGVAVMLAMLEKSLPNLTCVLYDREEGPLAANGLRPLLDRIEAPDLAIVLEPTDNKVQAGCVGSLHARLTFRGRRAHSARPWEGDNAIFRALPALERLRSRERVEVRIEGLSFFEVMTPTLAWTDGTRNVVPDTFHLNVNCRFGPGRTEQDLVNELGKIAPEAEIEVMDSALSGAVSLDQADLSRWIEHTGCAVEAKQAWTDVAQLTARGIPAVNFGPGHPGLAHQAEENVKVASLEECFELLQKLFV